MEALFINLKSPACTGLIFMQDIQNTGVTKFLKGGDTVSFLQKPQLNIIKSSLEKRLQISLGEVGEKLGSGAMFEVNRKSKNNKQPVISSTVHHL